MKSASRRSALLVTASVFALTGIGITASQGDIFVPTDPENAHKPATSFGAARSLVNGFVSSEIEMAQKTFGVPYTKEEILLIHARIWNHVQIALLAHYRPEEQLQPTSGGLFLTEAQRTRLRETVSADSDSPRVTKVDFAINIGTVVPRDVHVVEVPEVISTVHPEWRGYRYFVYNDEIVVVEPKTSRIAGILVP